MQGFGISTLPDGSRYEGWWHKDKRQGFGKYTSVKYGMWDSGRAVKWYDED